MQRSTFALGVTAALLVSGFAHSTELRQMEVSYSDLDLTRADQAGALYQRIQHAASTVCAENSVPASRALLIESKCIARAVDAAVQNVGNANLSAIYRAKTGKRALVASNR
jgi:UrcA family protein